MPTTSQPFQPSRHITAFWHRERNFGDQLTRLLLARLGVKMEYATAAEADVIGVGSILDRVPAAFQGTILRTGLMFGQSRREFPAARVLSVRGRLTAERCKLKDVPLGDLGLTVRHLFRSMPPIRRAWAVVPHYVDRAHPFVKALQDQYPHDVVVIDVTTDPRRVLEEIAASEAVISSSLRGLVAAQALTKSAQWILLSDKVYGGGFKFRDHFSAIGATCQPLAIADAPTLTAILRELQPASSRWQERGDFLNQLLVEWVQRLPISVR